MDAASATDGPVLVFGLVTDRPANQLDLCPSCGQQWTTVGDRSGHGYRSRGYQAGTRLMRVRFAGACRDVGH